MERPPPSPDEIRAALGRVVAAPVFATARRSAELLRYIVEAAVKTPGRPIKEQELGAEALGRGEKFDPRFDPIARVEASRVRGRLAQHYAAEGATDPVRIDLPKGGYTPVFGWAPAQARPSVSSPRQPVMWFAAGVGFAAIFAAVVFAAFFLQPSPAPRTAAFDAALGAPGILADQVGNSLAISPDGQMLAMHVVAPDGSSRLFVRRLPDLEARELPGTVGASAPFFSPDGQWVGFQAGYRMRKTRADGSGSPVTIINAVDSLGASWSDHGAIVASLGARRALSIIPEEGGEPTTIGTFEVDGANISWPDALPEGRGIVFASIDRREGRSRIEAVRLDGGDRRLIAPSGTYPRYAAGHLFYVDRGTLFALPFDIRRLEATGEARPIVSDVAYRDGFGYAFYDVSDTGDLAYLRSSGDLSTIAWLDGGNAMRPLVPTSGRYFFPTVSPDGRKLAYAVADGPVQSLRVLDLATGATTTLGNGEASEAFPVWTSDSRRLFFQMDREIALGWREADGSGDAHATLRGVNIPRSMSAKGDRIAMHHLHEKTHFDIWTAPVRDTAEGLVVGEPETFAATDAVETYPAISPDGRWLAYASNEGGDFDIIVSPYPEGGRKVKLSAFGARVPVWSATKQEIFYSTSNRQIIALPYTIENGEFVPGEARPWSSHRLANTGVYYNFDLAPDGRSIAALLPADSDRPGDHITVVLNALGGR